MEKHQHSGLEFGIYTFGELLPDPHTNQLGGANQRIHEIIEAAKLADAASLDVFGVGEHHRLDFAISSPEVVLAAIAQNTKQIRLMSATTVLSTADPVRIFEEFATLDILSNGRAEIAAGKGAFLEPYFLFGYDLKKADSLFSENMNLLKNLNENDRVTWTGQFRSYLFNAEISPRPIQNKLPIWIGVGSSIESAERAGRLGTGLMIAMLGGEPALYQPMIEAYRQAGCKEGHNPALLKAAVATHAFISETSQKARDEFYPYYTNYFRSFMKNGQQAKLSRADFEQMAASNNCLYIGSPQEIIEKILRQYELFGHQRVLLQMDIGGMPFERWHKNIELFAKEVLPVIRKETKKDC